MGPHASRAIALMLTLGGIAVSAQQPPPSPLAFDVVSIKPNRSDAPGRIDIRPGGRIEWTNTTLRGLLGLAYMRFPFDFREIVNGPSWINAEGFTIVATTDRALQTRPDGHPMDLIAMVQALVEDRFQAKVHNETRDAAVYALVPARSDKKIGPGLRSVPDVCAEAMKEATAGRAPQPQPRRAGPPPCAFFGPPGRIAATAVTMAMFANVLSGSVGRSVIDRTGLVGSFDVELAFDPASTTRAAPGQLPGPTAPDTNAPSIFTALQEQLGLKLESTRGPVDVLVIDRVERPAPD